MRKLIIRPVNLSPQLLQTTGFSCCSGMNNRLSFRPEGREAHGPRNAPAPAPAGALRRAVFHRGPVTLGKGIHVDLGNTPACLDWENAHNRPMRNSFPVDAILPELGRALTEHGRAVLTAAPGSGKTTRVPLALLGLLPTLEGGPSIAPLPGKILVLEPRRLAARAAAQALPARGRV